MKNLFKQFISVLVMLTIFLNQQYITYADSAGTVIVNGEKVLVSFTIINGTLYSDSTSLFSKIGASFKYDSANNKVKVSYLQNTATYSISSKSLLVNGKRISSPIMPKKINNKWYIPTESMSKYLGLKYSYNKTTNILSIYDNNLVLRDTELSKLVDVVVQINSFSSKDELINTGTGVYISNNGEIATTFRLIENAEKIQVVDSKGNKYDYKFVKSYSVDDNYAVICPEDNLKIDVRKLLINESSQIGDLVFNIKLSNLNASITNALISEKKDKVSQIITVKNDVSEGVVFNKFGSVIGLINNESITLKNKKSILLIGNIIDNNNANSKIMKLYDFNIECHTLNFSDASYYGDVKNGLPDGIGMMSFDNGDQYIGEFSKGKIAGYGIYTWSNGDSLEGISNENGFNGSAIYKWADGTKYIGNVINDNLNGQGEKFYKNGSYEKGSYINGILNGYGELITIEGSYKGNFVDGVFDGIGKLYDINNTLIYDGLFSNGYVVNSTDNVAIITDTNKTTVSENSYSNYVSSSVAFPLKLYSDEDKRVFLGDLYSSSYATDGIFNQYSQYGSEYGNKSIWNSYGRYGSEYSNLSAFNKYANRPPLIIDNDGNIVGKLSINKYVSGAISPYEIKEILKSLGQ